MGQEGQRSSPELLFKRLLSREEGSYRYPDLHLSSQCCPEKMCVLPACRPTPAAGGLADRPMRIVAGRVATLGPHHSLSRSQEHSWVPRKPEAILVDAPCVSKQSVPRTPGAQPAPQCAEWGASMQAGSHVRFLWFPGGRERGQLPA